ncbi:MAG TPA: hypothetical protein VF792_00315 [Ktedonobacterales bacterium]
MAVRTIHALAQDAATERVNERRRSRLTERLELGPAQAHFSARRGQSG